MIFSAVGPHLCCVKRMTRCPRFLVLHGRLQKHNRISIAMEGGSESCKEVEGGAFSTNLKLAPGDRQRDPTCFSARHCMCITSRGQLSTGDSSARIAERRTSTSSKPASDSRQFETVTRLRLDDLPGCFAVETKKLVMTPNLGCQLL